jgi:hypothetical protein
MSQPGIDPHQISSVRRAAFDGLLDDVDHIRHRRCPLLHCRHASTHTVDVLCIEHPMLRAHRHHRRLDHRVGV